MDLYFYFIYLPMSDRIYAWARRNLFTSSRRKFFEEKLCCLKTHCQSWIHLGLHSFLQFWDLIYMKYDLNSCIHPHLFHYPRVSYHRCHISQLKNNYTPETIVNVFLNFFSTSTTSFYELEPPNHRMETKYRFSLLPQSSLLYPQRDS